MTVQPDISGSVQQRNGRLTVSVRAQPSARKNAILGVHDQNLKVSVTAAPENGQANAAIAKLLARTLGVPKGSVKLQSGQTHRNKRFSIEGITRDNAIKSLQNVIAE